MNTYIFLILVLTGLAYIFLNKKKPTETEGDVWPFYPKQALSNPEQVLYFRIVKALPECIVLPQVQLSRFLGVKKGNNFATWNNRINRMSADFLICRKDATVIAAVELDDASHSRDDRKKADQKKNKALADAGVRLIRWNVKAIPNVEEIQQVILKRI